MNINFKDSFYSAVEKKGGTVSGNYISGRRKISIKCSCGKVWRDKPYNVVAKKKWCPICSSSKGENGIMLALDKLKIQYTREYIHPEMYKLHKRKCRYDFYFVINNQKYIIEFDGKQHFELCTYFGDTPYKFKKRQYTDKFKTKYALDHEIKVIRIDYTQESIIEEHIHKAIKNNEKLYYSSKLYK